MNDIKQLLKKRAEQDREKYGKKGRKKKNSQPKSEFDSKSIAPHSANLNRKNVDEVNLPQEPSSASTNIINEYAVEASKSLEKKDNTPKVDLDSIEGNKNYNAMLTKYVGDLDIKKLPRHHLASLIPKLDDDQELRKLQFQRGGTANRVYISKDIKIIYDGGLQSINLQKEYNPEIMIFLGGDLDIFWFIMEKFVIRPYIKKSDRAEAANILRNMAGMIKKTGKAEPGFEWLVILLNQKIPGERNRDFFARLFRVSGKLLDWVRHLDKYRQDLLEMVRMESRDKNGCKMTLTRAMNLLKKDKNYILNVELEKQYEDFKNNDLLLSDDDFKNIDLCIQEELNPKVYCKALIENKILEHVGDDENIKIQENNIILDLDQQKREKILNEDFMKSIKKQTKERIAELASLAKLTPDEYINRIINDYENSKINEYRK